MATELTVGTAGGEERPGVPSARDKADDARPRARRRAPAPRTVLGVASLGVFIAFVDATIVNVAFPDLRRSFPESGLATLSWVLNAYNIVFAAFLVAAGRLADLLGRRRVFLAGLVIFTGASALCAVAPSPGALIAARVVQALGAALLVPSSLGLVLEAFPADRRTHAVALLTAVGAVAAGVGPALGGLLVTASDWRLVFLVNVPLGIAAWVLSRRHLVESRSPGRRRLPDLPGALAFALAVSALVLGVTQGEEWGWTSTGVLACVAATVAGLALVAWRSTWHRSPVVDLGLLRIRTFTVANAMSLVSAAGFYGYTLANILFLTEVWGYSVLEAGLAITPGPFVAAAVAGPASRLAVRVGHRAVLAAGGLLWGAAVLWLVTRVGTAPAFAGEWLPATVLLGIGAGITLPNLAGAAIGAAPGESFATATGLNSVARQVGAALGVALVVAILGTPSPLEAAGAFDRAWLFAAACLGATGLGCLALGVVPRGQAPALAGAARVLLGSVPSPDDRPRRAAALRSPLAPAATAPGAPETPAEFLARVPVLAGLPSTVLEALDAESEVLGLRAGEWLFRQGDAGDAMYVVRAGRLDVVDEETGGILRVLGRGAALGELSLLTSAPRSAGVRAARRSEVLAIARATFERLMVATPEGSLALARGLGLQLRDSRPAPRAVRPVPVTVALLPGRAAARSVLEDPPAVLREAAG